MCQTPRMCAVGAEFCGMFVEWWKSGMKFDKSRIWRPQTVTSFFLKILLENEAAGPRALLYPPHGPHPQRGLAMANRWFGHGSELGCQSGGPWSMLMYYPPGNESISHLGKRKIIDSKVPLKGDMLVPRRVVQLSFWGGWSIWVIPISYEERNHGWNKNHSSIFVGIEGDHETTYSTSWKYPRFSM